MVRLKKLISFKNTCFGHVLCWMFGYSSECARTLQSILEDHFRSPSATYLPENLRMLFKVNEELTRDLPATLLRGLCVFVYADSAHVVGVQKTNDNRFLIFDPNQPELYLYNSIPDTEWALVCFARSMPGKDLRDIHYVTFRDEPIFVPTLVPLNFENPKQPA